MFQRRRCCVFDSPGLPNDSAGYPGLMYGLRGTTPSVLCFFWFIRHKRFYCKRAFTEKAQHLRRWISLRTFPRGRRGTSLPRAIKGTTRTELRGESIHGSEHIHWNIDIKLTLLHRYNICNGGYIHWNIGITPMELRGYNIQNSGYIHWNVGIKPILLYRYNIHHGRYIHWDINTIPLALRISIFVAANGLIRGDDIVDN